MDTTDPQVYARALSIHRRGCPLWIPEPNADLRPEHLKDGAKIGEVGLLTNDGGWDFLFNVLHPANSGDNVRNGVPEGFEKLGWDGLERTEHIKLTALDESLVSPTISYRGAFSDAAGVRQWTKVSGKAGIDLPNGLTSIDVEAEDLTTFREYALKHCSSWRDFVEKHRGSESGKTTIYFITGVDKTDTWVNASSGCSVRKCGISLGPIRIGKRETEGSSLSRCHPATKDVNEKVELEQNQIPFVRGFRISAHPITKVDCYKMFAPLHYHPLNGVNDWLLSWKRNVRQMDWKRPTFVITHDNDWIALLDPEDKEIPDDATLIKRMRERFSVVTSSDRQCVYLLPSTKGKEEEEEKLIGGEEES